MVCLFFSYQADVVVSFKHSPLELDKKGIELSSRHLQIDDLRRAFFFVSFLPPCQISTTVLSMWLCMNQNWGFWFRDSTVISLPELTKIFVCFFVCVLLFFLSIWLCMWKVHFFFVCPAFMCLCFSNTRQSAESKSMVVGNHHGYTNESSSEECCCSCST